MELFVVATPIGNLGDASERLRACLEQVDVVAAEDTRRAHHLYECLKIKAPKIINYFDHNEAVSSEGIIQLLKQGKKVALVSDAGTPCISDPGYRVVAAAHAAGVKVTPIPGPSALITIIQSSGLPSDCFTFVGFLPRTSEARAKEFAKWKNFPGSVVFFETAPRILDAFEDLRNQFPDALCALGRELTKMHEEIVQKTVSEMTTWLGARETLKGEFAVMIDLRSYRKTTWSEEEVDSEIQRLVSEEVSTKDIVSQLETSGWAKDQIYKKALKFK